MTEHNEFTCVVENPCPEETPLSSKAECSDSIEILPKIESTVDETAAEQIEPNHDSHASSIDEDIQETSIDLPATNEICEQSLNVSTHQLNDPQNMDLKTPVGDIHTFDIPIMVEQTSGDHVTNQDNDTEEPLLPSKQKSLPFATLSFVFSSNGSMLTTKYRALIEENGGKVLDKFVKTANYMLVFSDDEINPNQKMIRSSIPLIKICYIDDILENVQLDILTNIENYRITIENENLSSASPDSDNSDEESVSTPRKRKSLSDQNTPTETPTRRSTRIRNSSTYSPSTFSTATTPKKSRKASFPLQETSDLGIDKENITQVNVLIETSLSLEKGVKELSCESNFNKSSQQNSLENTFTMSNDMPVLAELDTEVSTVTSQ